MIRPYHTADCEAVVSIWRAASTYAHPFLEPSFVGQEADNLRTIYLIHAETWVIEQDGSPAGFIGLLNQTDMCEIGGLFVDPALHGKGLGFALTSHARALKGALAVEVFARNPVGRRFYKRFGFVETGRYVHEQTGQDVIRMRCQA